MSVTFRQLRNERGLSQKALADRLGVILDRKGRQGAISSIESGKYSPTIRVLYEALGALGYELEVTAIDATSGERRVLDVEGLRARKYTRGVPREGGGHV
jgi:transcriptional regulator with XRE-family HTH domain